MVSFARASAFIIANNSRNCASRRLLDLKSKESKPFKMLSVGFEKRNVDTHQHKNNFLSPALGNQPVSRQHLVCSAAWAWVKKSMY